MEQKITMIAPEVILADDNARFGLLPTRLDNLKQSIKDVGQVNDAIEVEPIEATDGCTYRVTVGHYRHAAALALNAEEKAGLMLPCVIVQRQNAQDRLVRQVSENNDRQNLTPMDSAIAIKAMMDAGVARLDIRKAFARPNVKGKLEAASNAWLNMMTSFLGLPKGVQNKIHAGLLPVYQAYMLTKVPKEKQAEILQEAENDRAKEYAQEDKLEQKFLDEERKANELEAKKAQAVKDLEAAKAEAEAKEKELAAVRDAHVEAFKAATTATKDAEAKKKAKEELAKIEKVAEEKEKEYVTAVKAVEKAEGKSKSAAEVAKERMAKLKKSREEADKKKKAPTREGIEKAAAKVLGSGVVALAAKDIKEIILDLTKPNGDAPKVCDIAKAFQACFYGSEGSTSLLTPPQLLSALKKITGEYRDKKKVA